VNAINFFISMHDTQSQKLALLETYLAFDPRYNPCTVNVARIGLWVNRAVYLFTI